METLLSYVTLFWDTHCLEAIPSDDLFSYLITLDNSTWSFVMSASGDDVEMSLHRVRMVANQLKVRARYTSHNLLCHSSHPDPPKSSVRSH